MKKRQKSLFSRNSWTGLRTRTSDRPACQALVLVTMTSGCPQSQVLFFIFFVGDHIQDGVVDNDNDYHDDKKILRLGNDLVWWLHQQCAPRGRRQGKVTIFKSQFINYSNTTKSCSKRRTTTVITTTINITTTLITAPPSSSQVISNSECNGAYGGITNNMLCAADASGNGGSDACQVDKLDHHDVDGSREG